MCQPRSGSAEATAHLTSPTADGLFHRAILQSTPFGRMSRTLEDSHRIGRRLLEALGLAERLGLAVVVVARPGLGTLNHTALTLEALDRRAVPCGVVLGAWPAEPELVPVEPAEVAVVEDAAAVEPAAQVPDRAPVPPALHDAGWLAPA